MTDKELQKLGRRELLQMLLEQAKETERLSLALAEAHEQLRQSEALCTRLRGRLDHKDEQIHELRDTLQAEREKRDADLTEAGSLAEAALRLNGVFDAAQRAADWYLSKVREIYPLPDDALPAVEETFSAALAEPTAKEIAPEPPAGETPQLSAAEPPKPKKPSIKAPAQAGLLGLLRSRIQDARSDPGNRPRK